MQKINTFKKLIILSLLSLSLFAFQSKYLPNYDIQAHCDKILHKTAYDICYSCKNKTPIMSIYAIDARAITGKHLSRKGLNFTPDYNLPNKCRSYRKDYSKTGFDRGHLCPNAVFNYSKRLQKETFKLSNIAPQKPNLNRKLWSKIEKFARFQSRKYKKVNIITGVCGSLGHIRNNVNIPAYWYKIIFLPNGKIISFLAPNTGIKRAKAKEFLTTLDIIEDKCGINIIMQ